jgi:hypothetical protein
MTGGLRYLVFGGEFGTEPRGGMRDLLRSYAIKGEAIAYAEGYVAGLGSGGWAHVYDQQDRKEVWVS